MKLLIVEDERDLLLSLKKGFEKKLYTVDTAADGNDAFDLWEINSYDLIILDLNLPGMDGIDVLKKIRNKDKTQKVLILSARSQIQDKVIGLDLGANDYLAKPFDFLELDARVRNLLRTNELIENTTIVVGELLIDTIKKEVKIKKAPLDLAPREYSILEFLALKKGNTISAEELIDHVWSSEANLFTDSVKVHISDIRRKIAALADKEYIQTIRGQGYLLEEKIK